jgi:predicted GNAT family N-acyltransferase
MRLLVGFCALSLLLGGVALGPASAGAAEWIPGADSYASAWVKDIEMELNKKEYRTVFLNDPRTPQASVLRLLNRAAIAHKARNEALAQQLVREALEVIENGVRKRYYAQEDVQPITSFIKQHVPVKLG